MGFLSEEKGMDIRTAGEEKAAAEKEKGADILLVRLQGKDEGKAAGCLYGPQLGGVEENVVGFRVMGGGNSNNGSFRFHKGFLLKKRRPFPHCGEGASYVRY